MEKIGLDAFDFCGLLLTPQPAKTITQWYQHRVIRLLTNCNPMKEKSEKSKSLVPLRLFAQEQGIIVPITAISDGTAVDFYQKVSPRTVYQPEAVVTSTPSREWINNIYSLLPTMAKISLWIPIENQIVDMVVLRSVSIMRCQFQRTVLRVKNGKTWRHL